MTHISNEELTYLQQLTTWTQESLETIGTKQVELRSLHKQIAIIEDELRKAYEQHDSIEAESESIREKIQSKYGDCKIDLQTGQIN